MILTLSSVREYEYLVLQFSFENIRQFYKVYFNDQIGETVFSQFENIPSTDTGRKFYLSWSHYLVLMRIDDVNERHFYEIEAVKNDWSLSELKRQFNSALYQRLMLITDKDKVLYRYFVQTFFENKKKFSQYGPTYGGHSLFWE